MNGWQIKSKQDRVVRIDTLPINNAQTQGPRQREIIRNQSPQHLENATGLMQQALRLRPPDVSRGTLVLGAGACTEVPLAALAHDSDEVVLADLDSISLQQARAELVSPAMRKIVHLVTDDLSGGISTSLDRLLVRPPWVALRTQGPRALFDAAASCLECCPVPDPPQFAKLVPSNFGLVISSLVLSQLFSYPLLDVLDRIQRVAPEMLQEQEHHQGYQKATQAFQVRVIVAHLHLLRSLLDSGGIAVLLCDQRGFIFGASGSQSVVSHRRTIPLVPHAFFELLEQNFTIVEKCEWEWLTDIPVEGHYGRGYNVTGYLLR
jgi:hypothetical protein